MANSLLNTPAICPVSSPSNSPDRNETHSVRGATISRNRGDNPVETLYSTVPNTGSDIEIDKGCKVVLYK